MIWLGLSAGLMVITAVAHSVLSEAKLMPAIHAERLTRIIIRYALHAMSLFMLLSAVTVAWLGIPTDLIAIIGFGWLLVGLLGLVVSKGRHRGWPVIAGAGITALIGAWN